MKKSMIRSTLGLFALLFMLSSTAWSASANENYQVDKDVQSTPYAPLDGGAEDPGEWGQLELLGDIEVIDPNMMMLAEPEAEYSIMRLPPDKENFFIRHALLAVVCFLLTLGAKVLNMRFPVPHKLLITKQEMRQIMFIL